jgi:hypothetical protein
MENVAHVYDLTTHFTGTTHVRQKNTTPKFEWRSCFLCTYEFVLDMKNTKYVCTLQKHRMTSKIYHMKLSITGKRT